MSGMLPSATAWQGPSADRDEKTRETVGKRAAHICRITHRMSLAESVWTPAVQCSESEQSWRTSDQAPEGVSSWVPVAPAGLSLQQPGVIVFCSGLGLVSLMLLLLCRVQEWATSSAQGWAVLAEVPLLGTDLLPVSSVSLPGLRLSSWSRLVSWPEPHRLLWTRLEWFSWPSWQEWNRRRRGASRSLSSAKQSSKLPSWCLSSSWAHRRRRQQPLWQDGRQQPLSRQVGSFGRRVGRQLWLLSKLCWASSLSTAPASDYADQPTTWLRFCLLLLSREFTSVTAAPGHCPEQLNPPITLWYSTTGVCTRRKNSEYGSRRGAGPCITIES